MGLSETFVILSIIRDLNWFGVVGQEGVLPECLSQTYSSTLKSLSRFPKAVFESLPFVAGAAFVSLDE
jgi:hypothetical protein